MNAHFVKKDELHIQINSSEKEYLDSVKKHLTAYVKNYRFMKKYKKGVWDGTISVFDRASRSFPYGLLLEVIRYTKKEHPEIKFKLSNDVKSIYKGIDVSNLNYDLALYPYDYQKKCIEALLKSSKGIVNVATAGGKSLIITYLIYFIQNINPEYKALIIVPTKQLVRQFKDDMYNYGYNRSVGIVDSDNKEFDNNTVISTWQSLNNKMNELQNFDIIVCDEVHTASANILFGILKECKNAIFRFGVTGTMPPNRLDELNVVSYLGPVLKKYTGKDLADLGYVAKCTIKQIHIKYRERLKGTYNEIKNSIFKNEYRMRVIKEIISKNKHNILLLVEKVETEGVVLMNELKKSFPDKNVVFLSGKDKSEIRNQWRKYIDKDLDDTIIIATYGILSVGVNIPSLKSMVLCSSTKSYIRVIQSLGRILRKHNTKEIGGAVLYDICDSVKHLISHSNKRNKHYIKEGYDVEDIYLKE